MVRGRACISSGDNITGSNLGFNRSRDQNLITLLFFSFLFREMRSWMQLTCLSAIETIQSGLPVLSTRKLWSRADLKFTWCTGGLTRKTKPICWSHSMRIRWMKFLPRKSPAIGTGIFCKAFSCAGTRFISRAGKTLAFTSTTSLEMKSSRRSTSDPLSSESDRDWNSRISQSW